jgi:tetratricopeptide (TPR) repeat protein
MGSSLPVDEGAPVSILSRGQWRLHGLLGGALALLLATSLYLTADAPAEDSFPRPYQAVLLAHLVLGVLVLAVGTVFVLWHLRAALAHAHRSAVSTGLLLTVLAGGLGASGVLLVIGPSSHALPYQLHRYAAVLLPLLYLLHRRFGATPPRAAPYAIALGSLVALGLGLGGPRAPAKPEPYVAAPHDRDPFVPWTRSPGAPAPSDPFFPSSVVTRSGKLAPDEALLGFASDPALPPGTAECARCHADIVAQWSESAHRLSSFENPFYAAAVESLRADPDKGVLRARWCAGCHDPAVLLTGRWEAPIDKASAQARAGLTCLACHAIDGARDVGGNGGYVLRDDPRDPYLFATSSGLALEVHDRLVRANPAVHKRHFLDPAFGRSSELCATCHKVSLEEPVNRYRWIRGQNEYDAWHASGVNQARASTFYLPPGRKVCQDCHMPLEAATRGDLAAKNGSVRSHRFAGANTALPTLRGAKEQLAAVASNLLTACRVDVFALTARGETIAPLDTAGLAAGDYELHVVVRNRGVGHGFPGGTADSNEVWLEVEAKDDAGHVLLASGGLAKDGTLDPTAHLYRTLFLDKNGHPIDKRNPQDIRATVFGRSIGPGKSDLARYRLSVPAGAQTVTVTARLKYRKFDPAYTRFALPEKTPELPVILMAEDAVTLGAAPAKTKAPAPWERWNDYGAALLEQGDTRGAAHAFEQVSLLAPARADGPRNEARVALADGRVEDALAHLQAAERVAPNDGQSAFFFGEALVRAGRLPDAALAYERAIERFPLDRDALRGLAEVRLKQAAPGDAKALVLAREAYLAILAIDPEDRGAHYGRMRTYEAEGDTGRAAQARLAFERYRLDEEMKARVTDYLNAHPDANRETQPVHVH